MILERILSIQEKRLRKTILLHLIVYYPHHQEAAELIRDMCNDNWKISTMAISVMDLVSREGEEDDDDEGGDGGSSTDYSDPALVSSPMPAEVDEWGTHWDRLKINNGVLLIDPRAISRALNEMSGTSLEYITLLGNHMEIPIASSYLASSGGVYAGSDYWYGTPVRKDLSSYIPFASVSRIPPLIQDVTQQFARFDVDEEQSTNGVLHISVTAGDNLVETNSGNLSLALELIKNDDLGFNAGSFYQPIFEASSPVATNEFKIVVTQSAENDTNSGDDSDNFTIVDTNQFPYIIQRVVRDTIPELQGSIGVYEGDDLRNAYDSLFYGASSILVVAPNNPVDSLVTVESASYDDPVNPTEADLFIAGDGAASNGINHPSLDVKGFPNLTNFGTAITTGANSFVLTLEGGGAIYAVTGYSVTADADGTLSVNTLTISGSIGDELPEDSSDFSGASFELHDASRLRDDLNNLNVDSVRYILPGFLKDEDESLQIEATGSILDLSSSSTAIANKLIAWNNHMQPDTREDWYNTPNGGTFTTLC